MSKPFANFSECVNLESVICNENSELKTIEEEAFSNSQMNSLTLPSDVVGFDKDWRANLEFLNEINAVQKENKFICFDGTFLLKKSDIKSDIFDILLFAGRSLDIAVVPSHIERISSSAFNMCSDLAGIEYNDDSELEVIDSAAVAESSIKSIVIPP